jgi:hypothetical protein
MRSQGVSSLTALTASSVSKLGKKVVPESRPGIVKFGEVSKSPPRKKVSVSAPVTAAAKPRNSTRDGAVHRDPDGTASSASVISAARRVVVEAPNLSRVRFRRLCLWCSFL